MCLNCGCGEPETRHKDTDITMADVRQAAAGAPLEETLRNMRASLDQIGTLEPTQSGGSGSQSSVGGQQAS
jgi:hypothetical protein